MRVSSLKYNIRVENAGTNVIWLFCNHQFYRQTSNATPSNRFCSLSLSVCLFKKLLSLFTWYKHGRNANALFFNKLTCWHENKIWMLNESESRRDPDLRRHLRRQNTQRARRWASGIGNWRFENFHFEC